MLFLSERLAVVSAWSCF